MNLSSPGAEEVIAERRDGVMVLTLNRPDRLNAWNAALENRYFELLDEAEESPEVRAIVVTGAGRGFCSGADMQDLETSGATGDFSEANAFDRERPHYFPRTLRKPLIAAINGAAAGLGLVEALYCDVRFATPTAKLTTAFAHRGLIAEYGISWLLPRLVGTSRALDLLLSGRIVLGEEAHRIGLVDFLLDGDELLDGAVAYADSLARNCSPTSMTVIKDQLRDDQMVDFETAAVEANRLMIQSFEGADLREGVDSYVAKRPPNFAPLPPLSPR